MTAKAPQSPDLRIKEIGTARSRTDGALKVTGRATYAAEYAAADGVHEPLHLLDRRLDHRAGPRDGGARRRGAGHRRRRRRARPRQRTRARRHQRRGVRRPPGRRGRTSAARSSPSCSPTTSEVAREGRAPRAGGLRRGVGRVDVRRRLRRRHPRDAQLRHPAEQQHRPRRPRARGGSPDRRRDLRDPAPAQQPDGAARQHGPLGGRRRGRRAADLRLHPGRPQRPVDTRSPVRAVARPGPRRRAVRRRRLRVQGPSPRTQRGRGARREGAPRQVGAPGSHPPADVRAHRLPHRDVLALPARRRRRRRPHRHRPRRARADLAVEGVRRADRRTDPDPVRRAQPPHVDATDPARRGRAVLDARPRRDARRVRPRGRDGRARRRLRARPDRAAPAQRAHHRPRVRQVVRRPAAPRLLRPRRRGVRLGRTPACGLQSRSGLVRRPGHRLRRRTPPTRCPATRRGSEPRTPAATPSRSGPPTSAPEPGRCWPRSPPTRSTSTSTPSTWPSAAPTCRRRRWRAARRAPARGAGRSSPPPRPSAPSTAAPPTPAPRRPRGCPTSRRTAATPCTPSAPSSPRSGSTGSPASCGCRGCSGSSRWAASSTRHWPAAS